MRLMLWIVALSLPPLCPGSDRMRSLSIVVPPIPSNNNALGAESPLALSPVAANLLQSFAGVMVDLQMPKPVLVPLHTHPAGWQPVPFIAVDEEGLRSSCAVHAGTQLAYIWENGVLPALLSKLDGDCDVVEEPWEEFFSTSVDELGLEDLDNNTLERRLDTEEEEEMALSLDRMLAMLREYMPTETGVCVVRRTWTRAVVKTLRAIHGSLVNPTWSAAEKTKVLEYVSSLCCGDSRPEAKTYLRKLVDDFTMSLGTRVALQQTPLRRECGEAPRWMKNKLRNIAAGLSEHILTLHHTDLIPLLGIQLLIRSRVLAPLLERHGVDIPAGFLPDANDVMDWTAY